MKNFLLPLLVGLALGASAYHFFSGKTDVKECFICIERSDLDKVSTNKDFLDTVKGEDLIAAFTFTTKINEGFNASDFKTRRIDAETASLMRTAFNESCSETDTAVIFGLMPLLNALMDAKGISTIESTANEVEKLGLITVFARYPNPFPADPDKSDRYTSIIQFGEMSGSTISDVFYPNTQEVIRYNFGNLCPDQCPPSLRPVTNPSNPTDQTVPQ